MFENRQIAAIEGKCRRLWNSSECLKIHAEEIYPSLFCDAHLIKRG